MNTHCLNCDAIRTHAVLRAGGAVAMFACAQNDRRVWTHLMPGQKLSCFSERDGGHVDLEHPHDEREGGHGL